jgi:hypothetical protein
MSFLRALRAETAKLRRTLALGMVFVAPLLVVLLQFLIFFDRARPGQVAHPWETFASSVTALWCIFMLPLLVTLETALLAGLEHGPKMWKHLYALPVPRPAVYLAKLTLTTVLIAGATLVLCGGAWAGASLLRVMKPALGMPAVLPLGPTFTRTALACVAAQVIVSLQLWVAVRWPAVTVALGTGIAGTFVTLFAASGKLGRFWPWAGPANVIALQGERRPLALAIGVIGGLVFAVLGAWETTRRDVE